MLNGGQTAEILVTGTKQYLEQASADIPIQENKRSDEVIQELINRAQQPAALANGWVLGVDGHTELGYTTILADTSISASLDTGQTTFTYAGDTWTEDTTAMSAIFDVCAAERGRYYMIVTGKH